VATGSAVRLATEAAALPFWAAWLALTAVAFYLLRRGTRAFWRLRTVTDTPTARVQSAPQGYVELAGLARREGPLLAAKLTGTPCLWYRYRIEQRQASGRSDRWMTLERAESEAPFRLADASGTCLIDPRGAELSPRRYKRWTGPSRDPSMRTGRGADWLGLLVGEGRYRFTEERIVSGDPLYVLGRLETPRRGPEERERLRLALLRVWMRNPARMAQFDRNGDGHLDEEEWEAAREEAARLAERSEAKQARLPPLPRVGATGDPSQPFGISAYTEEELAARLGWQALGFGVGFVGLAAGLGWGLSVRLGGG
jgi:hypothetical protein